MATSLDGTNVSYYTIPVALLVALLPRTYSGLAGPGKKYFDPGNPRTFVERLEKADGLDKQLRLRLMRAESCGANAIENLPLFAAAVTAGNAAGLSTFALNSLSIGYIASRLLYTWVYIFGQDIYPKLAFYRTYVWGAGIGCIMTMFIKAGLKGQN